MNGGRTGAYHISAPWGDSALASMFGSNAVAMGGEEAQEVFTSMQEEPEPFNLPGQFQTAGDRGSCNELCDTMPALQRPLCRIGCQVQDIGSTVAIMAIGVGLVIVGALALTR